jgi:predicted RNA-binding Zn ribbon-like protein
MSASAENATLFDLCGGHPALDFVNSLDNRFREDGPNEMLATYADLLRFLEESRLLNRQRVRALYKSAAPDAAERALRSVKELRETAAAVFYGRLDGTPPTPADLRTLERFFLDAQCHRELQWNPTGEPREGSGLLWSWGRFQTEPELPVWILAQSLSDILLSDQMGHVRTCAADTCRWLFLDTSKNHTRRWCNMKVCGNRMKARRFQARRND